MKIFLDVYLKQNLGDDIFVKMFLDRYDEDIYTYTKDGAYIINDSRLKIYHGPIYRALNILLKLITFKKIGIKEILARKADVSVMLGGSLFIESKHPNFSLKSPYYVLGSNFGPYQTDKYLKKYTKIFSNAEDVCFREQHSKELFKLLPNVRATTDIVLSLDVSKFNITNSKNVLISVINCKRKLDDTYTKDYENKIIEIIDKMINKGYEITLMSFCKNECDEITIENIINKMSNKDYINKINKFYYNGNIDEALNIIASSEIIFGSRFHANILGMVFGKTVIPISYDNKTINLLKDIGFKGKQFDIRNMNEFNVSNLNDDDLNYKYDISKQKKLAEESFINLDKILKRR